MGINLAKTLVVCLLHIVVAYALTFWGLVSLARWTGVPTVAPIVALFFSLPVLAIGILHLSFGGYRRIPPIAWISTGMMVSFGAVFLIAIVVSKL